jgi:hypothetical protein
MDLRQWPLHLAGSVSAYPANPPPPLKLKVNLSVQNSDLNNYFNLKFFPKKVTE